MSALRRVFAWIVLGAFFVGMFAAMAWAIVARGIPLWQSDPQAFLQGGLLAIVFVAGLMGLMRLFLWAIQASV